MDDDEVGRRLVNMHDRVASAVPVASDGAVSALHRARIRQRGFRVLVAFMSAAAVAGVGVRALSVGGSQDGDEVAVGASSGHHLEVRAGSGAAEAACGPGALELVATWPQRSEPADAVAAGRRHVRVAVAAVPDRPVRVIDGERSQGRYLLRTSSAVASVIVSSVGGNGAVTLEPENGFMMVDVGYGASSWQFEAFSRNGSRLYVLGDAGGTASSVSPCVVPLDRMALPRLDGTGAMEAAAVNLDWRRIPDAGLKQNNGQVYDLWSGIPTGAAPCQLVPVTVEVAADGVLGRLQAQVPLNPPPEPLAYPAGVLADQYGQAQKAVIIRAPADTRTVLLQYGRPVQSTEVRIVEGVGLALVPTATPDQYSFTDVHPAPPAPSRSPGACPR